MSPENLYILRYALVPEEPRRKRLDLLLEFCDQGKIDEVMFFVLPEEYNRGQWRPADYEPWLEFALEAKTVIEGRGIATSLNPWHTLLHCDRGRRSEDLKFRRMVLDTGHQCLSVGCPICADWQKIFFDSFRRFAQAGFKKIWIEDDFRFHNHNHAFGWGGCFCDEHIKLLASRGAHAKTREELIANLNAVGSVHPDRLVWMDLNGKTYIDLARKMRSVMDEIDPQIKLGLMTSAIPTHSVEGRDWSGLITALGGPERAMVRPHGAQYAEVTSQGNVWSFANLSATLNVLPKGTKSFFEVENAPMSRFAKSNQQTKMQMAFAVDAGCDGLTLDVLDFLGTGPASEPDMAKTLSESKTKLSAIRDLVAGTRQLGVRCLVPTDTCRQAPGRGIADIRELPTANYGWFATLSGFGYPCTSEPMPGQPDPAEVYALAGEAVWGLQDRELKIFLETCTVLLDADAAKIISDRGMANLIGLKGITRYERHADLYTFEQHVDTPKNEIPERASLNLCEKSFIHTYDLTLSAQTRTMIFDCFSRPVGTGCFTYRNPTGGRGLVLPHRIPCEFPFHVWSRKIWFDRWIEDLSGGVPVPRVVDAAWMYMSVHCGQGRRTIFLANQTFEVCTSVQLRLPEDFARATWRLELASRSQSGVVRAAGNTLTVDAELAGNDWIVLASTS